MLSFEYRADDNAYFDSQTGTIRDFSGRALIGDLAGNQLQHLPSRTSFWFSYAGAYPGAAIYLPTEK